MSISPIERGAETAGQMHRPVLRIDPLLFVAAIGLSICSFIVLHPLTSPYLGEANRQAIYATVGLVAAIAMSRFDYTVLREYRYVAYGLMIVLNVAVFAFASGAGGGQRRIPLPGFSFQSSSFGMLLLIISVSAFAVERSRRLSEHRTTARIMLFGLIPAMLVMGQSDLGDALIYVLIAAAVLFFMGTSGLTWQRCAVWSSLLRWLH